MLRCAAMTSASEIRLIVSDVDGVWTDGRIIYAGERTEIKEFNVRDGLAVKLAQSAGIKVALLTSRRSHALEKRARELGIVELHQGASNKLAELEQLARIAAHQQHDHHQHQSAQPAAHRESARPHAAPVLHVAAAFPSFPAHEPSPARSLALRPPGAARNRGDHRTPAGATPMLYGGWRGHMRLHYDGL